MTFVKYVCAKCGNYIELIKSSCLNKDGTVRKEGAYCSKCSKPMKLVRK